MRSAFALALGAALGTALCVPPDTEAQSIRAVEISPFAGETFFLHDGPAALRLERPRADPQIVRGARFEDTWSAGLAAGIRMNDVLALEALFNWTPTWLFGTNFPDGTDVYAYTYGLSAVAHAPVPGRLRPFAGVGIGGELDDYSGSIASHVRWMTSLQGGFSFDVGDGRALRVQARDFVSPSEAVVPGVRAGWRHDVMLSAGVTWTVPMAPRDAPAIDGWQDLGPRTAAK